MNIEYIRLSDGTTAITDENGIIDKRNYEISGDELLIENKMETIEKIIRDTKISLDDSKEGSNLLKKVLKSYPIQIIITILLRICLQDLSAIWVNFILLSLFNLSFFVMYSKVRKTEKGLENKLKKAYELKQTFEKEKENIKSEKLTKKPIVNNPVSLYRQNEINLNQINEQLETIYSDTTHSNPKKLILVRKK